MGIFDVLSRKAPPTIGAEFDHLAAEQPEFDPPWRSTAPTKKAAVVAIMRDEGLVILEWVAHYRAIGFDTIFVYTNDNIDGSDHLLRALHRAGVIRLIHNVVPAHVSSQFKAYRHAFWHSPELWQHEWVSFLDADEFLIPLVDGELASIDEYVEHLASDHDASSISLNWRWIPGNGEFSPEKGLLFERYRDAFWHDHVKTVFRLRDAKSVDVHHANLMRGVAVNGSGEPRKDAYHREDPAWALGHVNHYWNRSFQEYYVKRQRGRSSADRSLRDWSLFFHWSGETSVEEQPGDAHVIRVREGVDALRKLPGVASAERSIQKRFIKRVASSEVRNLYDKAKLEPNKQPPIAWQPRVG